MMTAVKRMTAKKDFLKMPLKERNCEVELYEDCRTRKLFEECKCVPWEVPGFQARIHKARRSLTKVKHISDLYFSFLYLPLYDIAFIRIRLNAARKEEIVLRRTLLRLSSAIQLVRGSMLMSSGLAMRWKNSLKKNLINILKKNSAARRRRCCTRNCMGK